MQGKPRPPFGGRGHFPASMSGDLLRYHQGCGAVAPCGRSES